MFVSRVSHRSDSVMCKSDSNPDSELFGLDSDSDSDSELESKIRIQEKRGGFGFSWIRIRAAWIRIRIRIRDAWIRTSLIWFMAKCAQCPYALVLSNQI